MFIVLAIMIVASRSFLTAQNNGGYEAVNSLKLGDAYMHQ